MHLNQGDSKIKTLMLYLTNTRDLLFKLMKEKKKKKEIYLQVGNGFSTYNP